MSHFNKFMLALMLGCWSIGASAQQKYTISGYITDSKSSETVIGATVLDKDSHHGAISNAFGFYSLTLGEGSHQLQCLLRRDGSVYSRRLEN